MKARMLLKKLTDHGLSVQEIADKIRLSPCHLVNDNVLTFVRNHKNDLLHALYDERKETHLKRKQALHQGRLDVARVLLWRFLNDAECREMVGYKGQIPSLHKDTSLETYLESELVNFDYELEAMIDLYRIYTPKPPVIDGRCKCGYNPPFCNCPKIQG